MAYCCGVETSFLGDNRYILGRYFLESYLVWIRLLEGKYWKDYTKKNLLVFAYK